MLLQSLLRPVLTPLMRGMFDAPIASSAAWSPLALWPDGIATPGMWISPRDLTSQWQDYAGTTPVVEPGTVADSANPVGLALDIRAGAPEVLGPELVTNGDFSSGTTGWSVGAGWSISGGAATTDGSIAIANLLQAVPITGKWCEISFDIVSITGALQSNVGGVYGGVYTTTGTKTARVFCAGDNVFFYPASPLSTATIDNISVREVPGNHMLQATSAARPLLSARVNLLTKTEDFSDAAWVKSGGATVVTPGAIAPDGTTTAFDVTFTTGNGGSQLYYDGSPAIAAPSKQRVYLRSETGVTIYYGAYDGGGTGGGASNITLTSTWTAYDVSLPAFTGLDRRSIWLYSIAAGQQFQIWHPQLNLGSTALPYQRVNTASDYDATGFPIAQKYDGVDDGMATAVFSAGTLINGMDCMIAVRRDSAAATYLISNTGSRGFFEWESGDTNRPDVSAGTPTYYVDGVAVTATKGALFTALTAGAWHILEARGLDLSAWTALEVSSLVSYRLNGPRGDIMLFPSTDSTEDKDAARQWLADYYGVTLP